MSKVPSTRGRAPRLYATRAHLAFALALLAVLVLGGGFWPLDPTSPTDRWFAVSGLLAMLACLTLVLPDRPWVRPTTLGVVIVAGGALLGSCVTAEGLVVMALGLITAAQFAAYAFPARVAGGLIGLTLVSITVGMIVAPAPFHAVTWAVILVMTLANTTLLGYVTHWLRQQATTDDLTGALTRGALLHQLQTELREAQRTGTPLTVVSADIDHFKVINDTRGHLAGDDVLTALVTGWRRDLSPRDAVGRTGGDEFVVVLRGRDRDAALRWVEDARARSTVGWSAGLAVAGNSDTARDLLDRADVALYAQKALRHAPPTRSTGHDLTEPRTSAPDRA